MPSEIDIASKITKQQYPFHVIELRSDKKNPGSQFDQIKIQPTPTTDSSIV